MSELNKNRIQNIIVVGGGTAGWISAAILARSTEHLACAITVVESPNIPTVGVGESTIPTFLDLLDYLKISKQDFVKKTDATFKLGIKFVDWLDEKHSYWHPFGSVGSKIDGVPFYHHWLKSKFHGCPSEFVDFSPSIALAKINRFLAPARKSDSILSESTYALHIDSAKTAKYLENYCKKKRVRHVYADVIDATLSPGGMIERLFLSSGEHLSADLFIDCTGQAGLLIDKYLRVKYIDWSNYLPADQAVVVHTEQAAEIPPYTQATALEHGWMWKIPLRNRAGNGYVYSSQYCDADQALTALRGKLDGAEISEARTLNFSTGKRKSFWVKNCVAVGLSGGFLEPLESTGIYLAMRSMLNLVENFPSAFYEQSLIDEYNRVMHIEYDCIRDFIVAHYCLSNRQDSEFWRSWKEREIPESLRIKLDIFSANGQLYKNPMDLFSEESWWAVLEGMGLRPRHYLPNVDSSDYYKIIDSMKRGSIALKESAKMAPTHEAFLQKLIG
ncbi:tryptophan 7-halogenase [Gilvimarinus agarilyticus]|uniref:tryptophan halogenase family protein n=1 Tax=Gilvimarinus sp. 2_MG-2023 TaxID=3062666 RepID=UPI001C093869|nr:tryptophan halogenase family protein [Gilvimarinus sp. 2_MG-2023]MBU2886368.1 tryptophan 7-halogenase [Gilvimarinus agarilyticus]MDO6571047.1 tryptophan 7-halogenase [Gilvimarinus sp. 2_MG-2023]